MKIIGAEVAVQTQKLEAKRILSDAKLYCTKYRLSILQVLLQSKRPLSEKQISLKLGNGQPDKVTIYRTLETFCDIGLLHKAYLHKRACYFELADRCGKIQCHPHFSCKKCGQTKCLSGVTVPLVQVLKKGFIIERQQVRLEGLCPACS